jgi:hypothetical protein
MTLKLASVQVPKEVTIATSVASRPRAIRMRPTRGRIVAGIERVPAPAEIDLKPGAEIHWIGIWRHANVAKITGAIARLNVHASAQSDC